MTKGLKSSDYNKESQQEQYFKFHKKVNNDATGGEYTILKNTQSGDFSMMRERVMNSKDAIAQAIIKSKKRLTHKNNHLLNMIDYSTKSQSDFCSTFYKIRTFWEFEKNDLQKEIRARQSGGKNFVTSFKLNAYYTTIF